MDKKILVVTGATGGIGQDICEAFLAQGHHVVVCGQSQEKLKKLEEQFGSAGYSFEIVKMDIRSETEVKAVMEAVVDKWEHIDVLINCAGVLRDNRIENMSEEDWDLVVDVSLKGSFLCCKHVVPVMKKQNKGRIINVSSRAYLGNPGQANYSAAKAGILGLTRALAKELGRFGITVNAIAPGLIETTFITQLDSFEKIKEIQLKSTPIKRLGQVRDVVNAALFLASDESDYITGEVLHITGGRMG